MTLPLPKSAARLIDQVRAGYHPGLALDKHLDPPAKAEYQKPILDRVCDGARDENLLASLNARRRRALSGSGAVYWTGSTQGPLTLYLSRATALENAGICLHPLYGFACLPGSGLKGLARASAERIWLEARPGFERENAVRRIREIFGYAPRSEDTKYWIPEAIGKDPSSRAGAVVFHDGWPSRWPTLFVDVAAVHHPDYYQADEKAVPPPGDWEDPNPNTFLAVETGTEFEFAVAPRRPEYAELAETAREWLASALADWGVGAKTASGYGRIIAKVASQPIASPQRAPFECTLELVTPAFLAGAPQKQEDCDLRGSTLRGQLRWWWRTMHAGHLEPRLLRRLETGIWGAASEGSAVRIAISPQTNANPEPFRGRDALGYLAYGMRERSRYCKPASSVWAVTVTARRAEFRGDPKSASADSAISPHRVREQACAALWLLTRYGGVGSKGRKGFGSLADANVNVVSSVDDCKRLAAALRNELKLGSGRADIRVPSLERIRLAEVPLRPRQPEQALAIVADAYRGIVKSRGIGDRIPLGLPRGKLSVDLGPPVGRVVRHPTSVHFHLARAEGGLVLRMTGFEIARIVGGPDFFREIEAALRLFLGSGAPAALHGVDEPPSRDRRRSGEGAAPPPSDRGRSMTPGGGGRHQSPAPLQFRRGDRVRNAAGDEGTVVSDVRVGETEMTVQIDGDLYPEKVNEWRKI